MKLATLCYVRSAGKTLMLLRNKKENDIHTGKWNGLGGKLNPAESPEECVIREVYEESGLKIIDPDLRGVLTFPEFSNGEDWYVFVYTADRFKGSLIESNEGQLEWIDDKTLLSLNLWEGDIHFLRALKAGVFFSGKFSYKNKVLEQYQMVMYHPVW